MDMHDEVLQEIYQQAITSVPYTTSYDFLSQPIKISCDDKAIDCFVRNYSTPYFTQLPQETAHPPAYHIVVRTDGVPQALIDLYRDHEDGHASIISWCFAGMARQITLGAYRIIMAKNDGWMLFNKQVLIIWPDSRPDVGLSVVRFAREAIVQLASQEYVKLHAGLVSLNQEHAAIVMGDSGAGKTTLLMSLAGRTNARLCASDRVLIGLTHARLTGYGTPLQSQVGERLLSNDFISLLDNNAYYVNEGIVAFWSKMASFRKASLSPHLLEMLFGATLKKNAGVSCVLIPELSLDYPGREEVTIIQDDDKKRILTSQNLYNDPAFPHSIYQFSLKTETAHVEDAIINQPWMKIKGNVKPANLNNLIEKVIAQL